MWAPNVTIPHKEAALALIAPDARANAVGAANTLWRDGGTLRSTNTDVEGFLGNLDATAPGWDRGLKTAVVLGAGGSARAVVFGLIERGVEPHPRGQPHASSAREALRAALRRRGRAGAWQEMRARCSASAGPAGQHAPRSA